MSNAEVEGLWAELIEFQHCQVGVEIVAVLLGLLLNVFFEELKVIRIVAEKLQVIGTNHQKIVIFTHRSILFNISGIVIDVPSSVLINFDIFGLEILL